MASESLSAVFDQWLSRPRDVSLIAKLSDGLDQLVKEEQQITVTLQDLGSLTPAVAEWHGMRRSEGGWEFIYPGVIDSMAFYVQGAMELFTGDQPLAKIDPKKVTFE